MKIFFVCISWRISLAAADLTTLVMESGQLVAVAHMLARGNVGPGRQAYSVQIDRTGAWLDALRLTKCSADLRGSAICTSDLQILQYPSLYVSNSSSKQQSSTRNPLEHQQAAPFTLVFGVESDQLHSGQGHGGSAAPAGCLRHCPYFWHCQPLVASLKPPGTAACHRWPPSAHL